MLGLNVQYSLYFKSFVQINKQLIMHDGLNADNKSFNLCFGRSMDTLVYSTMYEIDRFLRSNRNSFTQGKKANEELFFGLALAQERGYLIDPSPQDAIHCYQSAIEFGINEAWYRIGFVLEQNPDLVSVWGTPEFYYLKAAEFDLPEAWFALGQTKLYQAILNQKYSMLWDKASAYNRSTSCCMSKPV